MHVHSATTVNGARLPGVISRYCQMQVSINSNTSFCASERARSGSSTVSSCILLLQCLGPGMAVCVLHIKLMFPPICGLTDMQQKYYRNVELGFRACFGVATYVSYIYVFSYTGVLVFCLFDIAL